MENSTVNNKSTMKKNVSEFDIDDDDDDVGGNDSSSKVHMYDTIVQSASAKQ